MHCYGKKWPLPQWNLASPDSYRSARMPPSIDTERSVASDDTGMGPDCGLTSSRLDKRKGSWRLLLFPYPFIFPCWFLSKPPWFLLFPTSSKYAMVSLVQSSNALPLYPIMCPIPPASNLPQSVRWSRESALFWLSLSQLCWHAPGITYTHGQC